MEQSVHFEKIHGIFEDAPALHLLSLLQSGQRTIHFSIVSLVYLYCSKNSEVILEIRK